MSLFEKYGGFATISKIVSELYDELERDPVTAPYFEHSNIRDLMDHQVKFLSQVLGGPEQYTGMAMNAAHTGLQVTEAAFNKVAGTVQELLEDNGVEEEDVDHIVGLLGSLKDDIVTS
ncbi:MAG: group 1 truncated hemoglobin [Alphaproteobacteria bacterium]|nr:group 1 truncated hemoglobin [Alphaproteobacteria bacterium]